jgi:hypothetical protein
MLRINRTTQIPYDHLTPFAKEDSKRLIRHVPRLRMWEIWEDNHFVGVFILSLGSLVGTGTNVWFSAGIGLCSVRLSTWRALRRTFRRVVKTFGQLTAYVQADFIQGKRLVRFFGFHEVDCISGVRIYRL